MDIVEELFYLQREYWKRGQRVIFGLTKDDRIATVFYAGNWLRPTVALQRMREGLNV